MFDELDDFKAPNTREYEQESNSRQGNSSQNSNYGDNNRGNGNNSYGGGNNGNRGNGGNWNNNRGGGNGNWNGNRQGGGNSNWNNNRRGGGGNWQGGNRQPDEIQKPYLPVAMYFDKEFPEEVTKEMISLATRLIGKGYTVRINGDDRQLVESLTRLSDTNVEVYLPWRNFEEMNSKHYYNTETSKHVASQLFSAWDKVKDAVKAFLARNVRMMFGDKNNSPAMLLITWSKDGAKRLSDISNETGRASFMIKLAGTYTFNIINVQNKQSVNFLESNFDL